MMFKFVIYPNACRGINGVDTGISSFKLVKIPAPSCKITGRCHDREHKDTHHNTSQHNDTQNNDTLQNDTQHNDTHPNCKNMSLCNLFRVDVVPIVPI